MFDADSRVKIRRGNLLVLTYGSPNHFYNEINPWSMSLYKTYKDDGLAQLSTAILKSDGADKAVRICLEGVIISVVITKYSFVDNIFGRLLTSRAYGAYTNIRRDVHSLSSEIMPVRKYVLKTFSDSFCIWPAEILIKFKCWGNSWKWLSSFLNCYLFGMNEI